MRSPFFCRLVAATLATVSVSNALGDLLITPAVDSVEQEFVLKLREGRAGGAITLFLRNTGDQPVKVRQAAAALIGSNGQAVPHCRLLLALPGTTTPVADLQVANNQAVQVILVVEDLTRVGSFKGQISVLIDEGRFTPAASFTLVRPGQVRILGADYSKQAQGEPPVITAKAQIANPVLTLDLYESQRAVSIKDLSIEFGALKPLQGEGGQAATLNWKSTDETSESTDAAESNLPLTIDANETKSISLEAFLPRPGTYRTWMTLSYDGRVETYSLNLEREPPAKLELLEAKDNEVVLECSSSAFSQTITVINPEGKPPIDDLAVEVINLRRKDGKLLQGAVIEPMPLDLDKQKVTPGKSRAIEIHGKQLESTTYQATIVLSYRGTRQNVKLQVTRAASQDNLVIDEITGTATTTWSLFEGPAWISERLPGLTAVASVEIPLSENQNRDAQMYTPDVRMFILENGTRTGVSGYEVSLNLRENEDATPDERTTGDAIRTTSRKTERIPSGGRLDYVGTISGLYAGAYEGEVVVGGPDSKEVRKSFKVNVKDSAIFAMGVIALGCGLSRTIRHWTRVGRDRNLRHALIAEEREEVQRVYESAVSDDVWEHLLKELNQLQRTNQFDKQATPDSVKNTLQDLTNRRIQYLNLLDARQRLQRLLDDFPTEPPEMFDKKNEHLRTMDGAFQRGCKLLKGEQVPADPDWPSDVPGISENLRDMFITVRKDAINGPANELIRMSDEMVERFPELQSEARKLKEDVEAVKTNVNGAGNGPIAAFVADLDRARLRYAELNAEGLELRVRGLNAELQATGLAGSSVAVGVAGFLQTTTLAAGQALTAKSAEGALQACQRGSHALLGAQIELLALRLSDEAQPPDIEGNAWSDIRASVPQIGNLLKQARQALAANQFESAQVFYTQLGDVYELVVVQLLDARSRAISHRFRDVNIIVDQAAIDKLNEDMEPIPGLLAAARDDLQKRRVNVRQARAALVSAQLNLLESVRQKVEETQQERVEQLEVTDTEEMTKWTEAIPDAATELDHHRDTCRAALEAFRKDPTAPQADSHLLETEREMHSALAAYEVLYELIVRDETLSFARGVRNMIMMLPWSPLTASASPAVGQFHANKLRGPAAENTEQGSDREAIDLSADDWYARIKRGDNFLFWIVFALAILLGLQAEWVGNPTFGGTDYIAAFLWGFGTQEVAKGVTGVFAGFGLFPQD